ncbi:MAG: LptE family protein [Candidatus Aminicenantales bacterium]
MRAKKILGLALACMVLFHCGYYLRGTGSSLPRHIKRVEVPMFKNMTTRFDLDVTLTQSVIDGLINRGKVEVTSDSGAADAVLVGEINAFNVTPIAFTDESTADRYMITVVARIVFRDLTNQKVLFSNPSFVYQEEYSVPPGTSFETWESNAISDVAEKFAGTLINTLLEGF